MSSKVSEATLVSGIAVSFLDKLADNYNGRITKKNALGNEFDHVLLINRHGTSLLLIIIGTTLHAVINFCSIIVSFYVVCRFEQV